MRALWQPQMQRRLPPLTLHPRHDLTTRAKIDIQEAVTDAISRHPEVTSAELIYILLAVTTRWNIFAIRDEREEDAAGTGDPGTPAEHAPPHCHADRDGDCFWKDCPQLRENEPLKSGRHCPLDTWSDDE